MTNETDYTVVKREMDGRLVTIYRTEHRDAPVVVINSYMEAGQDILHSCHKHGSHPFHLVSVSRLAWDEDLSPWTAPPTVSKEDHFTGGAKAYSAWLEEKVLPEAEHVIGRCSFFVIAGYSMGGLFALYAPYISNAYERCVSGSGSVWFPGFLEYVKTHDFVRKPRAIYLSLGDKESSVQNFALRRTQTITGELLRFYEDLGIDSMFVLNSGGHYQDAPQRMAKGITWILSR